MDEIGLMHSAEVLRRCMMVLLCMTGLPGTSVSQRFVSYALCRPISLAVQPLLLQVLVGAATDTRGL